MEHSIHLLSHASAERPVLQLTSNTRQSMCERPKTSAHQAKASPIRMSPEQLLGKPHTSANHGISGPGQVIGLKRARTYLATNRSSQMDVVEGFSSVPRACARGQKLQAKASPIRMSPEQLLGKPHTGANHGISGPGQVIGLKRNTLYRYIYLEGFARELLSLPDLYAKSVYVWTSTRMSE